MTKVIDMTYTPFAHYTDAEYVLAVCNSDKPSDLELKSLEIIEALQADIEDIKNYIAELEAQEVRR